jgi:hypothetical protein
MHRETKGSCGESAFKCTPAQQTTSDAFQHAHRSKGVRSVCMDAGRCDVEHANKSARVQDRFKTFHNSEDGTESGKHLRFFTRTS